MNSPIKKICVTGATGFLGSRLLPKLLDRGYEVVCLARGKNRDLPAGARVVYGDLLTGEGVAEALEGADVLIHLAALLFGLGFNDYLDQNARAARSLVAAGKNLRKIIYVSSLAAAGPCARTPGKNEKSPPLPVSAYGWSKALCEEIFKNAFPETTILRPPIIYGSGDKGLLPLFRAAKKGFGTSPGFGRDFPVSVIHVEDAARAIILALRSKAGGVYHLSDGRVYTMKEICEAMGRAQGREKTRVFKVPLPIMGAAAALSSLYGTAAAKIGAAFNFAVSPPRWNLDKFREARQAGWLADSSRAERELGFRPDVSLAEGMAEAAAGYRALGWL